MNFFRSEGPREITHVRVGTWLGLALLGLAFCYLWILPVFRPRGDFLWGYYRLKDLLAGIPVALATLFALAVLASPSNYRRPLALRLTSVFISAMAILFICDIAYALFVVGAWRPNFWLDQAHITRRYSIADRELGFVRKAGLSWRGHIPEVNRFIDYRTDEHGFRNPAGVQRADIVFIGDSFTEAGQVNEEGTFARQVANASRLSSVNLGRGAYGPQQELLVLKRYGLSYQPRVVVWQLFEGNDLTDARIFADWKTKPQQNVSLKERYFNNSFLAGLLSRTRLKDRDTPLVTLRHGDGTTQRIRIRYRYEPGQPADIPLGFAETRRVLEEGYRLCQSRGIQLMIILVPTMVRVLEPYISFDRVEDRLRYLPAGVPDDKKDFSGKTAELCAHVGCTFVDSFDALRQAAATDNRGLYIPDDEHLDVRGHEVIAQIVVEWLRSKHATIAETGLPNGGLVPRTRQRFQRHESQWIHNLSSQ